MSKLNRSIVAIARCSSQFRSEKMAAYGLKGCHTSYLLNICADPGISQDKLAQRIYINKSNVARQAAFLEEQGYIVRQPSQADRRVLELYPTQKARALLPELDSIIREWDELVTTGLTESEIETVARILEKMQDKAGAWMNDR